MGTIHAARAVQRITLAVTLCAALNLDAGAALAAAAAERRPGEAAVVTLAAVGDIMVHEAQLLAQFDPATGTYDFRNNFRYVTAYIEQADIALGTLETTLAGDYRPYSGYPRFNAPDALAEALRAAGFDILVTANNHALDSGAAGLRRTVHTLRKYGLLPLGTRAAPDETPFVAVDVNGVRLGFSAYTFETPQVGGRRTINGLAVPDDALPLIDTFRYEDLEHDLQRIAERVAAMRAAGAEAVILYMHWGDEYDRTPNDWQRRIARALADCGVDVVLGSHPHVLQPAEWVTSPRTGRRTLVVYSLGNFLSNQRAETLNNPYTEDGLILYITLRKDPLSGTVTVSEARFVPTWVHRYTAGGRYVYEILPLFDALARPGGFTLTDPESVRRACGSLANTLETIAASNVRLRPFVLWPLFRRGSALGSPCRALWLP